jgi:hypothetical protein
MAEPIEAQDPTPATSSRPSLRKLGAAFLIVWAAATVVVGRGFTVIAPNPYDPQLFAYIGYEWTKGVVPYVDLWDNKPPGIFALTAGTTWLLGTSVVAMAVVAALFTAATLVVLYCLLRRWAFPRPIALAAIVGCSVAVSLNFYNVGGNLTELYLLLPSVLSVYCFVRVSELRRNCWLMAAGACAGVAGLIKTVGFAPLLAEICFLLLLAFWRRRISIASATRAIVTLAGGAGLAWSPAFLYFAKYHAVWAMLDASFFYNLSYGLHGHHGFLSPLTPVFLVVVLRPLAMLCAFAVAGVAVYPWSLCRGAGDNLASDHGLQWLLATLWFAADVAGALAGGRGYEHYFLALVPSLSVLAGFGLLAIVTSQREGPKTPAYPILIVFFVALLISQVQDAAHWANQGRRDLQDEAQDARSLVPALRDAEKGAVLFSWPYEPSLLLASRLQGKGPFPFATYHVYDSPRAYHEIGQKILVNLHNAPPAYVVDCRSCPVPDFDTSDSLHRQFRLFVAENYDIRQTAGNLILYRRKYRD